jgi:anti-sigma B factor antagonist
MTADSSPSWKDAAPAAIEVWSENDRTVIALFGEHDFDSEAELSDALTRFCGMGGVGDVVVDLSQATFIDSTTLATLLGARNLMLRQGRTLVLRAPSSQARRLLALCGLIVFVEPHPRGSTELVASAENVSRTGISQVGDLYCRTRYGQV